MTTALTTAKRNWFLFTLGSNISLVWMLINAVNTLPNFVISAERKKAISFFICCLLSRIVFYLNPHIKIKSLGNWDVLNSAGTDPVVILINHTSTLDAVLFAAMLPLKYTSKMRVLFKADLLEKPILRDLLGYCGHFPVHFKTSEVGKFTVDQEKQAKVIEDIKRHLSNGGRLALFPEGQLNRENPTQLQTFRNGSFKVFIEHEKQAQNIPPAKGIKMFAFLHTGLEEAWHPEATVGGNPAEVYCKFVPLTFSVESQLHQIQDEAQKQLDSIPSKFKLSKM